MANASVEAYKRRLMRIPEEVRKAAFEALAKNVQETANAMKAAAPRDDGTLAESVRIEFDPSNVRATIRAGGPTTTRPVREGTSVTYDYALAQEFGTEKMPANPFFWTMYRLYKKSRRPAVKRAMTKAIKKHFPIEGGGA
jgi:HK97 gp10 family phage protein